MKRSWLLILLMAGSLMALNSTAFAQDANTSSDKTDTTEDINSALGSLANRVSDVEKADKLKVEDHGFAESDFIGDDTQSFTEVVGNGGVALPGNAAADNGQLQASMRNTRLSLLGTTSVAGWATKGYLEADFYGFDPGPGYPGKFVTTGGSLTDNSEYKFYTQPTLRMRHAYLDAQSDGWEIMVGQYWTLFGWQGNYILATVDVQPIMGPIYERTEQLRVQKNVNLDNDMVVQVSADAERPEQIETEMPVFVGGIRMGTHALIDSLFSSRPRLGAFRSPH